ncbi:unnamed protein product [Schistocephalus solidus]|uniref:Tubulin domain-containing protein n=1 Tax=Schistocephalus solidus TaxID=70667 RepID=A0A183SF70_SCHSO|nr:unnamed protein product [Schistocephalus solidus]
MILMYCNRVVFLDELRTGAYRQFWNPTCLINGKEDAANNYARGHLTVGKSKMDVIAEEVLKMVERCDSLSAFEIVHSYAGGTGSGLTSLVAEHLTDQFGKKFRFTTSIFPSAAYSQSTVDPYNSILFTHAAMETIDCNVVLDNKALYDQCVKNICDDKPSLSLINRMVASVMSSLFLSHRFIYTGSQRADCAELLTNLIPYPRIHFPMVFYSPFCSRDQLIHEQVTIKQVTTAAFTQAAATMDTPIHDKAFISCAMLYRGAESPKLVYDALQYVKGPASRMLNSFVEWCPSTFKIGLNSMPPIAMPTEAIAPSPLSVCMVAGNVAVADAFAVNNERFDRMYQKRCFVHWFVGEGMEETEFEEARDELQTLHDDYNSLVAVSGEDVEEEEEGNNANVVRHNSSALPPSGFGRQNMNQNNRVVYEPRMGRVMQANRSVSRDGSLRSGLRSYRENAVIPQPSARNIVPPQGIFASPEVPVATNNNWMQPGQRTTPRMLPLPRDEPPSVTSASSVDRYDHQKIEISTKERNCNKPHCSRADSSLASVATLPIAVYKDSDSICDSWDQESCFDDVTPYQSAQLAPRWNNSLAPVNKAPISSRSYCHQAFVDQEDDDASEFLQMISQSKSAAPRVPRRRRQASLSRLSTVDYVPPAQTQPGCHPPEDRFEMHVSRRSNPNLHYTDHEENYRGCTAVAHVE